MTALVAEAPAVIVPQSLGHGVSGIIAPVTLRLVGGALAANSVWWLAGWRTWKEMGWPSLGPGARGFALGLSLGLAMAAVALLLEFTVGGARIELTGESIGAYGSTAVGLVGALAIAALSE